MRNIVKNSMDYFSMETKMLSDFKFNRVRRKFGPIGVMTYISLISLIYDKEGYYAGVTEDFLEEVLFLLSGKGQPDDEELDLIIKQLVHDGFFDQQIYDKYNVLTSKRIQETFVYATKRRKRWDINMDYWLLTDEEVEDVCGNSGFLNFLKEKREKINDTSGESVEDANIQGVIDDIRTENVDIDTTKKKEKKNLNIKVKEKKNNTSQNPSGSDDSFSFDYEKFQTHWNSTTHGMTKIMKLSDTRKKAIQRRVKEVGEDEFYRIVDIALTNPFLNGENDRGWTADFTWVMKPENFLKIAEGSYNRTPKRQTKPVDEAGDFLDEELRKIASGRNDLFDFEVVE